MLSIIVVLKLQVFFSLLAKLEETGVKITAVRPSLFEEPLLHLQRSHWEESSGVQSPSSLPCKTLGHQVLWELSYHARHLHTWKLLTVARSPFSGNQHNFNHGFQFSLFNASKWQVIKPAINYAALFHSPGSFRHCAVPRVLLCSFASQFLSFYLRQHQYFWNSPGLSQDLPKPKTFFDWLER